MTRPSSLSRPLSFFQHGSSVMRCHSSTMQRSHNTLHPLRSGSTVRLSKPQGFWDEILTRHAVTIPGPLAMKTNEDEEGCSQLHFATSARSHWEQRTHAAPLAAAHTHTHTHTQNHTAPPLSLSSLVLLRPPCFNCHTLIEELL